MAHFEDLSDYAYGERFVRQGTKAVGWLEREHEFPTAPPDQEVLSLLWLFCSYSVAITRGFHDCDFCPSHSANQAEREGQRLQLGTAEIRVFSRQGKIYAAPTLIYHYVTVHHYKPPDEFLVALREGPRPPNQAYFDALTKLNLEWSRTPKGPIKGRILFSLDADSDSRKYLKQMGTLSDIKRYCIELAEGLTVPFYSPNTNSKKERDDLLFEGTVHWDSDKNQWYVEIDEKSYRHESEQSACRPPTSFPWAAS